MKPTFLIDPTQWRHRATVARALAHEMDNPESKETMLWIARDYETIAERAAGRAEKGAQQKVVRIPEVHSRIGH